MFLLIFLSLYIQAHTAAAVTSAGRNVLVVLGGCDYRRGLCHDSAQVLDIDSWTWVPVPSSLTASRTPARASRVSATEEFVDDDAVLSALVRSHPGRGGAALTLLPHTRPRPRVTLVSSARSPSAVASGPALNKLGLSPLDTAVEDAVVTGYRVVLTLGCGAESCSRAVDTRLVSILDLDAVCPGSCALDRGEYAEEFGGGALSGRDLAAEDMSYTPAQCHCKAGFHGRFCELTHECPAGCAGNGQCVAEVDADGARVMFCRCNKGFWGVDCAQPDCPGNCNGRGVCVAGPDPVFLTSQLDTPHAAAAVAIKQHPLALSHCECRKGFHGPDCGLVLTPVNKIRCENDCSGHGLCSSEGKCLCDAGFTGTDCSNQCPALCSGRGICVEGGASALVSTNPTTAASAGSAVVSAAEEDASYEQRDDQFGVVLTRAAALPAGGSGTAPVCQCRKGFTGPDCSVSYCVRGCFGRGDCVEGKCQCKEGWGGEFCTIPTKCSGHGTYAVDAKTGAGQCKCDAGWGNPLCSQRVFCPHACTGNGACLVLPPISPASLLLQRPVGRDAFSAASLGAVLPTVTSEDAAIGEALGEAGSGGSLPRAAASLLQHYSSEELAELGVDPSLLQISSAATAATDAVMAADMAADLELHTAAEAEAAALAQAEADADADAEFGFGLSVNPASASAATLLKGPHANARIAGSNFPSKRGDIEVEGVCQCRPGWRGADCSMRECAARCRPGHGECNDLGECSCYPGFTGPDCGQVVPCRANCTSAVHGSCQASGICACRPGWSGIDCATPQCPRDCSGHGECNTVTGRCTCAEGFSGRDCAKECPNHCSKRGTCIDGACACDPGFSGRDCSQTARCPRSQFLHPDLDCSGHGFCFRPGRKCICEPGYTGRDCSQDDGSCGQGSCGSHGTCRHGQCFCDLGWSGAHCELQNQCPSNCHGHGFCVHGTCACYRGFAGESCDKVVSDAACPKDCSGNGFCDKGKCVCIEGHAGEDCAQTTGFCADNTCSTRGVCRFGQCHCQPGAFGVHCEKTGCDKCEPGKGVCVLGQCQCLPGFRGVGCAVEDQCPGSCTGHGVCILGTCACLPGYAGKDCSIVTVAPDVAPAPAPAAAVALATGGKNNSSVPASALNNTNSTSNATAGNSTASNVTSAASAAAAAAATRVSLLATAADNVTAVAAPAAPVTTTGSTGCPNDCSGFGTCHLGRCFCIDGHSGIGCESLITEACPNNCGGSAPTFDQRGTCHFGKCYCKLGYQGAGCETALRCPAHCERNGVCLHGQCFCAPGFTGAACERPLAAHLKDTLFASDIAASAGANAVSFTAALARASAPGQSDFIKEKIATAATEDARRADARATLVAKENAERRAKAEAIAAAAAEAALATGAKVDQEAYEAAAKKAREIGARLPEKVPATSTKPAAAATDAAVAKPAAATATTNTKPSLLEFASFIELETRTNAYNGLQGQHSLAPSARPALILAGSSPMLANDDSYVISFSSEADSESEAESDSTSAASHMITASHPSLGMSPSSFLAAQATTVLSAAHIACGPSAKGCTHGVCVKSQCMCLPGHAGVDCSVSLTAKSWQRCPSDCSNQGTCVNGRCFCHYGFGGDACQTRQPLPCPRDCSGHGVCKHGKCFCEPGFGGVACAVVLACKEDCGSHGVCFRGQCICADGYTGANCRTELPRDRLPEHIRASVHASRDDLNLFRFTNPAVEDLDNLRDLLATPDVAVDLNKAAAEAQAANANATKAEVVANAAAANSAINATRSKPAAAAKAQGTSFIDILSTLSQPSEVSGVTFDADVRADLAVAMAVSADEHAFACLEGCGAHGRCVAGRCYCEPGFAGALCHLALDEKAVAALEESRHAAALAAAAAGEDDGIHADEGQINAAALKGFARAQGSVVASNGGWTVPPLVLAMAAFCVGVLVQKVASRSSRKSA